MTDRNQLLNDNEEAQRLILDGRQSTIWTALPGIIDSVNYDEMTCVVQPAIMGEIEDENGNIQSVKLPLLLDVPICFPSGGGFIMTFPLGGGDEVLVIFASRCIDAWWQSGGVQKPMELRMHDLSDGFAIPGPRSLSRTANPPVHSSNFQIRNIAGATSYIEITHLGRINLVSDSVIDLTAPEVDIDAPVVKIAGAATTITGNLVVTGLITGATLAVGGAGGVTVAAGGALAAPSAAIVGAVTAASVTATTVTGGGKALSTHTHSGVQTGGGNTGPPV